MVWDVVTHALPRIRGTPLKLTRPHSCTKLPQRERKTPTNWACKGFRQHGSVSINARDEPTLHTLLIYTTYIQAVGAHPNTVLARISQPYIQAVGAHPNTVLARIPQLLLLYQLSHPLCCETIRGTHITSHKER